MKPGALAPDLPLCTHHGEVVSLRELAGPGRLLAVFYPFAFSPVCTREVEDLTDHHAAFAAADCDVVAVSCDSKFTLAAWAQVLNPPFPLLSDFWPHGAVSQTVGTFDATGGVAKRGTFLFDSQGRLRASEVSAAGVSRDFGPWLASAKELQAL